MNSKTETYNDSRLAAWLEATGIIINILEITLTTIHKVSTEARISWDFFQIGSSDFWSKLKKNTSSLPLMVRRLLKTGWMLTRISGSYRWWRTRSIFFSKEKRKSSLIKLHRKNAALFTKTSLEHGGAFLKIGQILSARADILPDVWVTKLAVLQDNATPETYSVVAAVIEEELGSVEKVFASFEQEPIAAASIGQVHKAQLKDGREVAVKVRRPGLESVIKMDMILLKAFLKSMGSILPETDLPTISAEIERAINEELDYTSEAEWMQKVGGFLEPVEGVTVPQVLTEYSSRSVLVSEFISGIKLTEALDNNRNDHALVSDLLGRLLDMYLRQVLRAGFFQADPHPGNILVTEDNTLVLLDFGCTMALPEQFRDSYSRILSASIRGNRKAIAKELKRLGFETKSGKPDTLLAFSDVLLQSIQNAARSYVSGKPEEMSWPDPEQIIAQARDLMSRSKNDPVTKLPPEFIMLARVFTTLGGLFSHYEPNLDVERYLMPHILHTTNAAFLGKFAKLYFMFMTKIRNRKAA